MSKSLNFFLTSIIDSIDKIIDFTQDVSYQEFESDEMRHLAVIHLIELIGEATTHLEEAFKAQYPNIPWKQIKGMRNFLIHEYWQVSLEDVWETVQTHIPELKKLLEKVVTEQAPQESPEISN